MEELFKMSEMEETLKALLQKLVDGKADHDNKIQQSNSKIEELLEAMKAPAVDADQVLSLIHI